MRALENAKISREKTARMIGAVERGENCDRVADGALEICDTGRVNHRRKFMAKDARHPQARRPEARPPLPGALEALGQSAAKAGARGLPPVHLWNPPDCGDIGMRIARDGTWFYQNTPILRPAMTRLFATILRRDPERYVLVTPVEMVLVEVEDAPFLAVEMAVENSRDGPILRFRTNVDDCVTADAAHPLRFAAGPSGGLKPYLLVRGGLEALVSRPLFYDLVARGETRDIDGVSMYGLASAGQFFPMIAASEIEDLA